MKILILTCRFGNGHYSAAKSIQQKLINKYEGAYAESVDLQDFYQMSPKRIAKDFLRELQNFARFGEMEEIPELVEREWSSDIEEVKIVDVFELAYPEIIDYIYKMYNQFVDKGAKLMNYMYKRSDENNPSDNVMFEILYNHVLGAVTKLLFKENPDIIISAFSICSELISIYKNLSDSTIPLITAITDIYPHSTWINDHTDYYLVAVEETKQQLIQNGVDESSIAVVGMPLSPTFENMKYKSMDEQDDALMISLYKEAERRAKQEAKTDEKNITHSVEGAEVASTEEDPTKNTSIENCPAESKSGTNDHISSEKQENKSNKEVIIGNAVIPYDSGRNQVAPYHLRPAASMKNMIRSEISAIKYSLSNMGTENAKIHKIEKNELVAMKNPYERRLLIMGGGLGMVPSDPDFYKRLNKIQNLKTTVVMGKNKSLYAKLKNRYKNVEVLGFVSNVDELMQRSDLLLTKSGGLTTFEAMYAELPMAIFKPFLAQEVSNAEFVVSNGLGMVLDAKLSSAEKEIGNIAALIFDRERLYDMKQNMRAIVGSIEEDKMLDIIEKLRIELSEEEQREHKLHKIARFE